MTFCEPGGTAACRTEQLFELLSGSHSDGKGIRILVFFLVAFEPDPWSRFTPLLPHTAATLESR